MQRYRVVIMMVLFGVLPVVVAFFVALNFLGQQEAEPVPVVHAPVAKPPPPAEPETRPVFAAARALPIGTLLVEDDLVVVGLAPGEVDENVHFPVPEDSPESETVRSVKGHAVRRAVAAGALLLRSAVVAPGQRGFLAAVLGPGTRAVTIRVGEATSDAGLIDPGDRVDVILSAELAIDGGERIVFARTIAEDVRVVAINSHVVEGDGEAAAEEIATATLEALPAQADRLVLGENEGRLSLAVRSLAPAAVARKAGQAEAVELREMLLSSSEFKASEARLRRVRELSDLATRKQVLESKEQLRTMVEAGTRKQDAVRILRGTAPAEEVVFERQ